MVKRIKKRIDKIEPDEVDAAELAEAEAPAGGLAAELAAADDDQFTRKTASVFKWFIDRRGPLIAVGVVAIIGVAIYVYMDRKKAAGSEEATASFMVGADAYQKYVEGVFAADSEGAPADLPAQLEKSAAAFAATKATYKDSGLAELAGVGHAGAQLDLGKYDEALAGYDAVLADTGLDPLLKAIALQGKAAALDSKGDHAGAIAAWQALEGLNRDVYGLTANLEIARLQEASGKSAAARTTYEKIKKDYEKALESFTNRSFKSDIERGLARLGPTK